MNKLTELRHSNIFYRNFCSRLNAERLTGFPDTYHTKNTVKDWNDVWIKNDYFNPKNNELSMKMILPPPNVTGALHLGHALTVTIQDVLARWYRMKGVPVVWIPGLDHAGIATQVVVEKYLFSKEGITRFELGKEEFLKHVENWKHEKGSTIENQLKSLAATLDWSKEYFTMSEDHKNSVNEAFVILNQRNLLYRNTDLVNWSPTLRSTISDIEVEYLELTKKTEIKVPGYDRKISFGEIVDVAFKIKDSNYKIIVSTTRAETMMGDVAIAVHPEDSRYSEFIGRQVWHPLREIFIPIIADSSVKRDFGSGAVKITPGHSYQDLEIARKNKLEVIEVIGEDGRMNENAKAFIGYPRFIAKRKILDELQNKGVLMNIKDHAMLVPICSRSRDVIEYLMREQWFIKTKNMAMRAADAVRNGQIKLDPSRYEELWFNKLDNIRDWCVSRQLWWGHQIPAYYCKIDSKVHWIIARNIEEARQISEKKFGISDIKQDNDVLDTWFSAALLPLSAVGWPNEKYSQFYPLSLMETGQDILFYWVARMAMLCTELSDVLPFEEVLLHGILCDGHKRKMSKSTGNVILPEYIINGISLADLNAKVNQSLESGLLNKAELKKTRSINAKSFPNGIPECGVDALRFTLCYHNIKDDKINFCIDECKTFNRFCNKIWQASKYVLLVTDDILLEKPKNLTPIDRWILSRLEFLVKTVNESFEQRNFHRATSAIRQFFHYEFCDCFIEATKLGLESNREDVIKSHKYCLIKCLEVFLRTLSPIMPYLTEELYSKLAKKLPAFLSVPSIIKTTFPTIEEINARDCELEEKFDRILNVTATIRNIFCYVKREFIMEVHIVLDKKSHYEFYTDNSDFIKTSTRINTIKVFNKDDYAVNNNSVSNNETECKLYYLFTNQDTMLTVKNKMSNHKLREEEELAKQQKN